MEGMAAEPGRPGLITTLSIHHKQNHYGANPLTRACWDPGADAGSCRFGHAALIASESAWCCDGRQGCSGLGQTQGIGLLV